MTTHTTPEQVNRDAIEKLKRSGKSLGPQTTPEQIEAERQKLHDVFNPGPHTTTGWA